MDRDIADRRIQRTRKLLYDALIALILEKGYEAITVKEVIEHANVGRSTFYSHFKDVEDLFLSGFENLWSLLEGAQHGQTPEAPNSGNLSLLVFQHAQHYTGVYRALVGKQGGQLLSTYMYKYLTLLIKDTLKSSASNDVPIPPEFVVHHLASSLIASLTWWVEHDLPFSAERMSEMFQQLNQPALEKIWQDS